MKRLRLQRWSGSVLSPRTRPCCLQHPRTLTARLQSSASSVAQLASQDDFDTATPTQLSELELRNLPSPPPSLATSSAKLSALHARLSLPPRFPVQTLARCLIDSTADSSPSFNNTSLSLLGNDLLGYYTSEAILCRYPRLPMTVIFAAMWGYIGPKTLAAICREWGVDAAAEPGGEVDPGYLQAKRTPAGNAPIVDGSGIVRKEVEAGKKEPKPWNRGLSSQSIRDDFFGEEGRTEADLAERPELREGAKEKFVTLEVASVNFIKAVVGAVYLHGGRKAAKRFFREHILSRQLDVGKLFEFRQPTRDLSRLCAREGFESPVARILSETGRASRHPVFVVGVFSGKDKLGEGAGGSLDEARIKAAIAALKGWYLYSPMDVMVPSDAEGEEGKLWQPVLVDGGEVVV